MDVLEIFFFLVIVIFAIIYLIAKRWRRHIADSNSTSKNWSNELDKCFGIYGGPPRSVDETVYAVLANPLLPAVNCVN